MSRYRRSTKGRPASWRGKTFTKLVGYFKPLVDRKSFFITAFNLKLYAWPQVNHKFCNVFQSQGSIGPTFGKPLKINYWHVLQRRK